MLKCHNAIRDILWHALLSDNKSCTCRREQYCSANNQSCPGDIYHPDFFNGNPACFDINVRNSLQSHFVCAAAIEACATENAGEMEKDERHEFNVTQCGVDIFPISIGSLDIDSGQS